jgi:iron complex transport system substrate-binding protein
LHRIVALYLFCLFAIAAPPSAPSRIISAAPNITEMLYVLGLGPKVVGVTTFCHYPPEVKSKPKIGSYLQPSMERIVALKPDLIIISAASAIRRDQFDSLRIPSISIRDTNLSEIESAFEEIGRAAGIAQRGAVAAKDLRAKLDAIRSSNAGQPRRTMLFVVGRRPNELAGIVAVGKGGFLNELIEIAGGSNIFGDATSAYVSLSLEQVLARNPEVIVDMGDMAETVGVTEEHKGEIVALWKRFPKLRAVENNRVFAVASDLFVVPGPRVTQAAEELSQMLRPKGSK